MQQLNYILYTQSIKINFNLEIHQVNEVSADTYYILQKYSEFINIEYVFFLHLHTIHEHTQHTLDDL